MLAVDTPAPDFVLSDPEGRPIALSDFRGSVVVLYFYPKDNTPGCNKEACSFRDMTPQFQGAGAKVIGISPDSEASHRKFRSKFQLPFTLLADPEKSVCTAYGVWKEKNLYGVKFMGVERSTFVIDREGIIRRTFPKVKVNGHAEAVLEAVKGLGDGE